MARKDDGGGRKGGRPDDGARAPDGAAAPAPAPAGGPAEPPKVYSRARRGPGRPRLVGPDGGKGRKFAGPTPLIVQKIRAALEEGQWVRQHLEKELGLGSYQFYRWETVGGSPKAEHVVALSKRMNISIEYLLDDEVPVRSPHPRRDENPYTHLADVMQTVGVTTAQVEHFLTAIKAAVLAGFDADQVFRLVLSAAPERKQFLDESRPGPAAKLSPSPLLGPTEAERRAEREARERDEPRRNGGPRPKTG